jgi:ferredoxin-NADP reductase
MEGQEPFRDENPTRGLPIAAPANMIPVQVVHRELVAPDVVSVDIVLPGTQQAPAPYLPGQFVTLALPTPRETLYRSYSLCGDGDGSRPWQLTIKRMELGAVSSYFYQHVGPGTLLYASLPRGTFTLPWPVHPEMCLVMVAAGSGITPIMGMLRALDRLASRERPLVQLHYASRSVDEIIFGDELEDMDRAGIWLRQWHYLSSEGNRMTANAILARAGALGQKAHWYMCGPDALKRDLQAQLHALRVPEEHVHSEVFATSSGAAYKVAAQGGTGVGGHVRIMETGAELTVGPNETLLTALERNGYHPEFSCRAGACGACKLQVVEGQVDPVGEVLSPSERQAGFVLSCIARPIGDITLVSGGRPPAGVARREIAAGMGIVPAPRGRKIASLRTATLVGACALLFGSWNLTNHRPASWDVASAAAAQPTATAITSPTTGGSVASPTTSGTTKSTPTAGQGKPTPTAKPGAPPPTATPLPKPTPTATCAPSKTC